MKRLIACVFVGVGCGGIAERAHTDSSDAHAPPIALPPPDAGTSIDAAFDSPPEGSGSDGPIGSWCAINAPYAAMCDDFDLALMPRVEWTKIGNGLGVDGTAFHSSPHALHAQGMSSSLAFGVSSAVGSKLELELQVIGDGTAANMPPSVASITAPDGKRVGLAIVPGTSLGRCTFAPSTTPFVDFPLARGSTWHDVMLKISFHMDQSGTTVNLLCVVDGTNYGQFGLALGSSHGNVTDSIGIDGVTSTAMEAYFDNVVADFEK